MDIITLVSSFFLNEGFIGTFPYLYFRLDELEDWVMLILHLGFASLNEVYLTDNRINLGLCHLGTILIGAFNFVVL